MASNRSTVDHIVKQMGGADAVSARKMFGEYGVYSGGKLVALICDDRLFVKPTEAGRRHVGEIEEAPPYKGAKPCFLIPTDRWDDRDWLSRLVRVSADELPFAAKKRMTKRD